jgi:hypothetical protein
MVQACCLVSDAWSGGGHPVALEVAPYCRKLLKYLLPAIQALQEQYNSASLPTPIPQTPSALSSTPSSASAATSSTVPTATTAAGTEADDSSGAGGDVCDVSAKCEASTQTDGSNARPQVPDKQQLQITLLLILAALHVSQGLGDSLIQSERSLKVEEWDTQLVTLGCGALSLLCDLLHNKSWRSAAQAHQPLLLLHATYTGLQVNHRAAPAVKLVRSLGVSHNAYTWFLSETIDAYSASHSCTAHVAGHSIWADQYPRPQLITSTLGKAINS